MRHDSQAMLDGIATIKGSAALVEKGDVEGHPFRGNQYTQGHANKPEGPLKVVPIGANRTELHLPSGNTVLFSYQTPVAANIAGRGFVHTDQKYSRTTSKHITQWLGGKPSQEVPQSFVNGLTHPKASDFQRVRLQHGMLEGKSDEAVLLKLIFDAERTLAKGDKEGHEFHGNQYTQGGGGGDSGGEKSKVPDTVKGPLDLTGSIIDYEDGNLSEDDTIKLFQHLVDTGMVNHLQGHYGRTAQAMLDAGVISPPNRK